MQNKTQIKVLNNKIGIQIMLLIIGIILFLYSTLMFIISLFNPNGNVTAAMSIIYVFIGIVIIIASSIKIANYNLIKKEINANYKEQTEDGATNNLSEQSSSSSLEIAAKVFIIIGMVTGALLIYPIVLGVFALKGIDRAKTRSDLTTWAIVTLLFINIIAGILMFCIPDKTSNINQNAVNSDKLNMDNDDKNNIDI